LEYLEDQRTSVPIQIFATDLSEIAIERARGGVYPASISADVSAERLRRFFTHRDGSMQINKSVRELCVFARQDLTRDPPFSKLDLIICRNVLIYLGATVQRKLMTMFHYALKHHGFLMLGHAESVGAHADLFAVADKKHRLYTKKAIDSPLPHIAGDYKTPHVEAGKRLDLGRVPATPIQTEATRLLLDKYTPPGVIVDPTLHIVQFHGLTGPFLEPSPGEASLHLLKMAREGLVHGLRTALNEARKGDAPARREGQRVKYNGHEVEVDLEVVPLGPSADDRHFLILFHTASKREPSPPRALQKPARGKKANRRNDSEIAQLQQELAANREYLQSIIQDLEAANEELQSANEEVLSSNEELQSTNEELDTAKEELQSTNEELNTLNDELHGRNEELSRVNSDLVNLLGSVQIAILIISGDMRIRRFTPMAERALNLIASDIGRPIAHIKPNIDCPDLEQLIEHVVDTMAVEDREVCDRSGRWYSLRIRPYKNVENRIDGAVLTLFDIDDAKKNQEQFAQMQRYAEAILNLSDQPFFVLDDKLRLKRANQAYRDLLKPDGSQAGDSLEEFHGGTWGHPELRAWFERALAEKSGGNHHQMVADFPTGRREVRIEACPIFTDSESKSLLVSVKMAAG
jgi:two-component system CheB/CheR fusion protein